MPRSKAKEDALVDVDTAVVRRNRVLVQHGSDAIIVIGFGSETERLSRLALTDAIAKAGFNPDEPRDERGRWTSEGGDSETAQSVSVDHAPSHPDPQRESANRPPPHPSPAAAAATLVPAASEWAFGGDVALPSLLALAELAARVSAPVAIFGTILIPTNGSYKVRGTVPSRPDIAFEYDRDTGTLVLSSEEGPYFATQIDKGLFHDDKRRVIGRIINGTIALDADAMPGYSLDRESEARTQAVANSLAERPQVKLCPDPQPENIKGRSEQALRYQEQITLMPRGLDFVFIDPFTGKDVRIDYCCNPGHPNPHCIHGDNVPDTIDAKGQHYQKFMVNPTDWRKWYRGRAEIEDQMERQARVAAALNSHALFYFAEPLVTQFFRAYAAEKEELKNVDVMNEPARWP